jgi:hypothetical protein
MCALYGIPDLEFSGALDGWQGSLRPEDRNRADAEITAAVEGISSGQGGIQGLILGMRRG